MQKNKPNFITSFMSKLKNNKASLNVNFIQAIGNVRYKYTLFEAKDDGRFHKGYAKDFDYISGSKTRKFHVANEQIAKALYEIIMNKQINSNNIPIEFKSIKFIVVEKLQKVVFITFDTHEDISYIEDPFKILSNVYPLVKWVTENLSYSDKNIAIDYKCFYESFLRNGYDSLSSFFRSIYLSEEQVVITNHDIECVINELLWFCDKYSKLTVDGLRYNLKDNINICSTPFYYFINRGIYMKDLDVFNFKKIPYHLCINIFRYITNRKCFDDLGQFFANEGFKEEQGIIFDKSLFEENLEKISVSKDFDVLKGKRTGLNMEYQTTFLQIKDCAEIQHVKETVELLLNENLINDVSYVYSPVDNQYYLCDCSRKSNNFTLHEYIEKIGDNENQITELIENVNEMFSSKANLRQNLLMDSSLNYLNALYINEENGKLNFGDLSMLTFRKDKECLSFQYPLCIMQIIEKYLTQNNRGIEDIYKCSFIKLFPKPFVDEIINCLNGNEYKSKGMIGKIKGILDKESITKIEFLENISLSDHRLLERISFVPGLEENDVIKECKAHITKPQSNKSVGYISVDDRIKYISHQDNLTLSKKLMDKVIYHTDNDDFLLPEKLLVSKDVYDEKNYIVIGVIWNKGKLYTLFDLIKSKVINTKNIYRVLICKLLRLYGKELYADKLSQGLGSLLLDDSYKIVFDYNLHNELKTICRNSDKSIKSYYDDVLKQIVSVFGEFLDKFECFDYKELFEGAERYLVLEAHISGRLKFCNEHQRLYLDGSMCKECKDIYMVADSAMDYLMEYKLSFEKSNFFAFNVNTLLGEGVYKIQQGIVWKNEKDIYNSSFINRVKLGIINGIYNNFVALVPSKLVIQEYVDKKNIFGVLCGNYDFSGMMHLTSFKYIQRIKVVAVLYKRILPMIENYIFLTDDKSVFTTMFMDKKYKGDVVIPNLPLLKCDVTVSSDEALKEKEKQKTLQIFSEFIYEYIISDEALCLEINKKDIHINKLIESIKRCDFDESYISEYMNSKDAYCKVHGAYFASADKICPECIVEGITEEKITVLDKVYYDKLNSEKIDYEGGEARLYFSEDGKIDKIFNDKVNISFKAKVIGKALQKSKYLEEFNSQHKDIQFVTIDKVLYSYNNGVLNLEGYRQNHIKDSFKISALKEKSFVDRIGYDRKDVVEILIKVCKGIEYLHSIGAFIGDLNGGNILIKDKIVYFIDMDGMSYDDVKNYMYTNTYIYPPSVENKNITELDDWYSLAVQAFYYLTYSHPFRGVCDDNRIPENEVERMKYGYSVLGEHGIKLPNISIGWSLLPKRMIDFFLMTFEGNQRESMLEILQSYLNLLDNDEMKFEELVRENEVHTVISENIYIDTSGNLYHEGQFKMNISISLFEVNDNVLYSDSHVIIQGQTCTVVINDKTGASWVFNKVYDEIKHAQDNAIYYIGSNNEIYVDEIGVNMQEINTHVLKRKTDNKVWSMSNDGKDKFVLLEVNDQDKTYDIYCNMTLVYSMPQSDFDKDESASVMYDGITDKWLVVISCFDSLIGIVIDKTGKSTRFKIDEQLSTTLSFYRNTLYFAGDKKIYMYNVNSKKMKTVYCNVITPDSFIERVDNKFIIINDKTTYRYIKS